MAVRDKIYNLLPLSLQNVAITIFGYMWQKRRFGGVFLENISNFKDREKFTSQHWIEYQNKELSKLLFHAYNHVPYYNKIFKSIGLNADKLKTFSLGELNTIPMLEKDTLRQFGKNDLLSDVRQKNGKYFSSSGSTGTPTQILISEKMHQIWSSGFEARIRNWAGVNFKTPRGTIGGRRIIQEGKSNGPYYRYNYIEKQVYFSAYHISKETVENYLEGMRKHHIEYMTGYAMSNYFLARFIEENGLKAPRLKAVITSSEKLTEDMRETFERVYQCKTFDAYSGVEDCGLISECEFGSLHISPDLGILEIIKNDGVYAKPGEMGELVCTGILNYDQPLIRYRIGDLVTLADNQECNCKRQMPIIKEIIGRIEDTVIGPDGREMVRFHGIFINIPSIIEGQIIQYKIDEFEIKIVSLHKLLKVEVDLIIGRMRSQVGDVTIHIIYVSEISRNQNGKFKSVISHVKRTK